jgi:hypothetical protein
LNKISRRLAYLAVLWVAPAAIGDDQYQWGLRFRTLSGDPRVFGRVYVATDGHGIIYGEPAHEGLR